jgi:hypothetical protein
MPAKQQDAKPVKVTFYLDPGVVAELDAARATLRTITGGRSGVTYSAIAQAALRLALDDLQERGPACQLASLLAKRHDSKKRQEAD